MKIILIIDMQNDFIDGALGSPEAQKIVPNIVDKINGLRNGELVLFTKDTHKENYLETQEGKLLPVMHCIEGTDDWCINKEVRNAWIINKHISVMETGQIVNSTILKNTFGSTRLARELWACEPSIESIELCGVCTDVCVISNALLLKAYMPEVPIIVDASCCAGTTPEKHKAALEVMKSCQIIINNER